MAAAYNWLLQLAALWLQLQGLLLQGITLEELCQFTGHEVQCWPTLPGQHKVSIHATINPCSRPVDITFHVKNGSLVWSHTFSNEDEMQQVSTLEPYVALHVIMRPRPHGQVHMLASFVLDRDQQRRVVDQTVAVEGGGDCNVSEVSRALLPMVLFFTASVLVSLIILIIILWRRRRLTKLEQQLTSREDAASGPYQEEAISSEPIFKKGQSTTVIQNSSYHDTLQSSTELPTISENSELRAAFMPKDQQTKMDSFLVRSKKAKAKVKAKGKSKSGSKKRLETLTKESRSKWSGRSMSDSDLAEVKQRMLEVEHGNVEDNVSTERTLLGKF